MDVTLLLTIGSNEETQHFRFLDLPPELRNKVYREALVDSEAINPTNVQQIVARIRLLQACHQIRAEAHDIFWSENSFKVDPYAPYYGTDANTDVNLSLSWLESLGSDRTRLIKSLKLRSPAFELLQLFDVLKNGRMTNLIINLSPVSELVEHLLRHGIPPSSIRTIEPSPYQSPLVETISVTSNGRGQSGDKSSIQKGWRKIDAKIGDGGRGHEQDLRFWECRLEGIACS